MPELCIHLPLHKFLFFTCMYIFLGLFSSAYTDSLIACSPFVLLQSSRESYVYKIESQ